MRRVWLAVLALVVVVTLSASANVDCGCGEPSAPACYQTFRSNEIIDFKLEVPVEYFWVHNVSVVPLITAWWVETQSGVVVKYVPFMEPNGHWMTFSWDQSTDAGGHVEPGFYRIVVQTTYDERVTADVQILSCCNPCFTCCPSPCACYTDCPCYPCCGELFLTLESGGTRGCCGFWWVSICASFEGCCP
jgi:hypothetical protein